MALLDYLSKELKRKTGWYILLAVTLAGIVLFIAGRYVQYNVVSTYRDFIAASLSGVGTLITVSGISGAVMKIFAVEGFFLDAVAEASFGPVGLSRLSDEKLDEVWLHATRILFLNNMSQGGQVPYIEEFRKELENRLKSGLPSAERHFVDSSSREIEIRWHDRENSIIEFHDTIQSKIVPFDASKPLSFDVRIQAKSGSLDDYYFEEKEPRIVGTSKAKLTSSPVKNPENTVITTTYVCDPSEFHEIIRERICRTPIAKDPNWNAISPYIHRSMDVIIRNEAEGLAVIFSSLGNEELFETLQGTEKLDYKGRAKFRLKKMLLPGQGYGLTMVKSAS